MISGADDTVVAIYTRTIEDLEEERRMAVDHKRYMSNRIGRMAERDTITEELFPGENSTNENIGETDNVQHIIK